MVGVACAFDERVNGFDGQESCSRDCPDVFYAGLERTDREWTGQPWLTLNVLYAGIERCDPLVDVRREQCDAGSWEKKHD